MKKNSIITMAVCLLYITAITFCIILSGGCHKQNTHTGNTYTSLTDFFKKNKTASQHFSFINGNGTVIQTNRGTKIHLPPNAFADLGNVVINGQVDLEVKQLLTPADMVLNDMPAMSGGAPLESGGEFFIGATANNKEVRLAPGKKIQVVLPALGVSMDNMKVYNGYKWSDDSIPLNGSPYNWVASTNSGNVVRLDTFGNNMFCDSIKWINCDRSLGGTPINYHVLSGNCPAVNDTRVFIHFTGRNAVSTLWLTVNGSYFTGVLNAAPVTIIGICIKDGRLWASIVSTTLQDGGSLAMQFIPTSDETLKATLSALK